LALAIVGLLAPSHPYAALSVAAGQILAAVNFFFLEKFVKLFTHAALTPVPGEAASARASSLGIGALKIALVYGGAFALTRWNRLELGPVLLGFSLPLAALVLKAAMLAIMRGVSPAGARPGATGREARPILPAIVAGVLLFGMGGMGGTAGAAMAQTPAAHGGTPAHVEAAAEHGGGEQHLPNWLTILDDWFPKNPVVHWMHENEFLVFAWLAALVFFAIIFLAMRRDTTVPGWVQNGIEWMVESMEGVVGGMLGKYTDRYFPFIMAIFFYVLTMNLIGIIPGFKSSTSTLDVTLALALITFLYVQFTGIRNLGILGYLDHMAGSPRDVVGFLMLPVMVPVHVLGELAKPVSLSCRLFGNIFGEDTLIVVFVGATALCLKASLVALAVPPMLGISALFMLLQALTSIVQALIFSLLATVYLYMMLPHEEHAHGDETRAHA